MIKLILLQNYTHFITLNKYFIKITHKYYNFWQNGLKPKNFPYTYILINLFTSPTFLSLTFGLVRQGHQRWVGSAWTMGQRQTDRHRHGYNIKSWVHEKLKLFHVPILIPACRVTPVLCLLGVTKKIIVF